MEEITLFIDKNKRAIGLTTMALMFIFFTFCPSFDVLGKVKMNALELVFKNSGAGFSKILAALMMLLPLLHIIAQFVVIKPIEDKKDKLLKICPLVCFLLGILLMIVLPKGVTLAWGTYLYLILAILLYATNFLPALPKKA